MYYLLFFILGFLSAKVNWSNFIDKLDKYYQKKADDFLKEYVYDEPVNKKDKDK